MKQLKVKLMLSSLDELAEPSQQMFLSKWFTYGIKRPINWMLMSENLAKRLILLIIICYQKRIHMYDLLSHTIRWMATILLERTQRV